jgi:phosphoglucomutase
MSLHPLAGKPAPKELLADIGKLRDAYFSHKPDVSDKTQRVAFGTSGHRGSSLRSTFNEDHVLAISQAICEYRTGRDIKRSRSSSARIPTPCPTRPSSRPSRSSPPMASR